jgi:uncharacterized protein (DUF58 family)
MATGGGALLSAEVLARLERLQLGTRRRLAGHFSGEHRSPRRGSSLDFADYRDYHQGDDFRRIDYSLYARTDQLFIRLFEAEDDATLHLVVDRSASMGFDDKLGAAARLAAALGFVGLVRRDTVCLHAVPSLGAPRRFSGRHATGPMFAALAGLEAGGASDLDAAATNVLAQSGPPGVTVLFSDLLSASWEDAIERLPRRGGDIAAVHVLSPRELDPQLFGDLELEDAESGEQIAVSLSTDARRKYVESTTAWLDGVVDRCRSRGVAYSRVMADDDVSDVLFRGWRREGLLR